MAVILVIDDSAIAQAFAKNNLSPRGHEVHAASDWIKGTTLLHRHHPDLILLDVNMPQLEGPEGLNVLRKSTHRKIPKILFFSSEDEQSLRELTIRYDTDGYAKKGMEGEIFADHIEAHLRGEKPNIE